ncbi:MAG: DUF4836 family protein [Muribaculaceae bacterium]|nr:DUF4836 family protein [Muribaculaceae bacterium]
MKRLDFLFTLLAILFLSSCTSSCSSTDEKLRAMIPNDALGVIKINLPSVLKKAGIMEGEGKNATFSIPSDLKSVIDQSNENIVDNLNVVGDMINNLPESGIDAENNCYIFLSNGTFQVVALLPLNDEKKAQDMVGKIVGEKMKEKSGIMFVSRFDYAFAIDDKVLMIAFMHSNEDDASAAAKKIFDKSKKSLLENEEIAKAIDVEDRDITAYIDAKGVPVFFESLISDMISIGDFSPADIFDGSGIKAITATVNFDDSKKGEEKVDIVTDFICSNNSIYGLLYDKVIATAASSDGVSALDALPGDFDTYFAVKVNGAELVEMPGVSKLLDNIPFKGINIGDIVSSLNGTLACGLKKEDENDYNFGVSSQCSSPDVVVNEIVNFANLHGQAPVFNANGEYQYDTTEGNKALVMNRTSDVVYLRCVNYVPTSTALEWPLLVRTLKQSTLALFKLVKIGDKHEGNLSWGLRNKTHGEGIYFTEDPDDNIVISTLKLLCWREPGNMDDDEEIGLTDY